MIETVELGEVTIRRILEGVADLLALSKKEEEILIRIDELCRRLCLKKNTVYWWVRTGKGFPVRRGNPLLFSVPEVKEWMKRGR